MSMSMRSMTLWIVPVLACGGPPPQDDSSAGTTTTTEAEMTTPAETSTDVSSTLDAPTTSTGGGPTTDASGTSGDPSVSGWQQGIKGSACCLGVKAITVGPDRSTVV